MKKFYHYLFTIIVLITSACSTTKDDAAITYKYHEEKFQFGNCDTINYECVEIKIKTLELISASMPGVKDSVQRKIDNFILSAAVGETGYNSIEELTDSLVENYKTIRKEIPEMRVGYGLERNIKVETDTLGIFTMEFFEYTFFGGAHPNSSTTYSNINLADGKEITLDELFIEGFENEINKIGEQVFRQQKELKSDEDLNEAGFWFEENKFGLNKNFAITADGIKFFFNSYEIAPYGFGTTEIIINYSDLTSIIKKGGLLERFVK